MKKKILIYVLTAAWSLTAISFVLPKEDLYKHYHGSVTQNEDSQNIIFLFLDRSDFSCQFCLSSFLQLCDTLQMGNFDHIIIRGFLDGSETDNATEKLKRDRILKKQIRGFVKGNNIRFPFFLDSSHVFGNIKDKDTAVIVLNSSLGVIRQWPSPLSSNDICEICSFVLIY